MPLQLERRFRANVCILRCKGPIVLGEEVKSLESHLESAARESCRMVLTVDELSRLDSIGLGLLVRCMGNLRKRGGDLRFAAPPRFLQDLLHMTRLNTLLKTYPTEDEAVQSFQGQAHSESASPSQRRRVLVIDRSADLGAFIRAVLAQHGYEVNTVSLVRDARTLLQFQAVDFILLGPDAPDCVPATALAALRDMAPKAAALALCPDFRSFEAQQAAKVLLEMFQAGAAAS
ncbi:MAG TPA: STAS domain-containing protein [Acidobacteriaceae bacterium]|jgi:anti-sigma B factor antagonist|nr:STAS domain-containing protein [Acidobacteriaceae bacterium]